MLIIQENTNLLFFYFNNTTSIFLFYHSSATLQPLDLTCNSELKRVLKLNFKPVDYENKPTKQNRLLYTTVECLQSALARLHVKKGFSKASIYLFSKEAPLKFRYVKEPNSLIGSPLPLLIKPILALSDSA